MQRVLLAADLGGTNLRMAAVSKSGKILNRARLQTPVTRRRVEIIEAICEAVKELEAQGERRASGLAIALPGTIDAKLGLVSKAPNLPDLEGCLIVEELRSKLGFPVLVENDANAAAVGEYWLGGAKGTKTSIEFTLGTGVGGGIIIDGELIRGVDGTAGEIGHIVVEPKGLPCGCGGIGCLEQYASATAIVRMATESKRGTGDGEDNFDAKAIYEFAVAGEEWAKSIFEVQGYYLGIVLSGLINSLNPEAVVVGGGASAGWKLFSPALLEQVSIRAYPVPAARAKILRSTLGDNAGLLGAARLAFDSRLIEVDAVV